MRVEIIVETATNERVVLLGNDHKVLIPLTVVRDMTYGDDKIVIVGSGVANGRALLGVVFYLQDVTTYHPIYLPKGLEDNVVGLCYTGGYWIAHTTGAICYAKDIFKWKLCPSVSLNGLNIEGSIFITSQIRFSTQDQVAYLRINDRFYHSIDGFNWLSRRTAFLPLGINNIRFNGPNTYVCTTSCTLYNFEGPSYEVFPSDHEHAPLVSVLDIHDNDVIRIAGGRIKDRGGFVSISIGQGRPLIITTERPVVTVIHDHGNWFVYQDNGCVYASTNEMLIESMKTKSGFIVTRAKFDPHLVHIKAMNIDSIPDMSSREDVVMTEASVGGDDTFVVYC